MALAVRLNSKAPGSTSAVRSRGYDETEVSGLSDADARIVAEDEIGMSPDEAARFVANHASAAARGRAARSARARRRPCGAAHGGAPGERGAAASAAGRSSSCGSKP